MLISHAIDFVYQGGTAFMHVLRNDGYCWGRIVRADGSAQLDVNIEKDMYDANDTDALAAFIDSAQSDPSSVEPVIRDI